MSVLYDVAIIGFGPSGAVAAALNGQAGSRVFVCDRVREVYDKPRAIALDHEIMRLFQQIGIVEQVVKWSAPFRPSEYFGVHGQLIKRIDTVAPPYPLAYTPTLVFTQPPVETALRAHVAAMSNVDVALGTELTGLTQTDDRVTLELRAENGPMQTVTARYVIACDGAASPVRQWLGIELDDLVFDEPWLVVDLLVNEKGLAKLPKDSVQYCEPDRPCTLVVGPKNHRRWEISLHPDEDPKEAATSEGTWRLLSRWLTPDDAELWRQASYRFHALVARQWRQGRVFLAGDAAHQQPPFLGQGMCQGIRDVANLSWKLKAMLDGSAGDDLLDTYGAERGAHVRQLTTRIKEIGAVICERDVAKAIQRDEQLLAATGGKAQTTARQDIIPPLTEGLLSTERASATGTLFPQPWVKQGVGRVRMDTLTGTGWRLVLDASFASAIPDLPRDLVGRLGLTTIRVTSDEAAPGPGILQETEGVLRDWFLRHGCRAAIVRPDHYVFAVASSAAQVRRELDALARRIGPQTIRETAGMEL